MITRSQTAAAAAAAVPDNTMTSADTHDAPPYPSYDAFIDVTDGYKDFDFDTPFVNVSCRWKDENDARWDADIKYRSFILGIMSDGQPWISISGYNQEDYFGMGRQTDCGDKKLTGQKCKDYLNYLKYLHDECVDVTYDIKFADYIPSNNRLFRDMSSKHDDDDDSDDDSDDDDSDSDFQFVDDCDCDCPMHAVINKIAILGNYLRAYIKQGDDDDDDDLCSRIIFHQTTGKFQTTGK